MKQEDKEPLRKRKKNVNFNRIFTNMVAKMLEKKRSHGEKLTCNELNTAKIYRNGRECVLTARTPKIQEIPSIGRSTATAFAVSLETKQGTTVFLLLAFNKTIIFNN